MNHRGKLTARPIAPKHPAPRVIAVDVDGTLHVAGLPNHRVIEWCRKKAADGFTLILWSSRGEAYARNAAKLFGVEDLFPVIISKPGYIVDDMGWSWIKYTHIVRNLGEEQRQSEMTEAE